MAKIAPPVQAEYKVLEPDFYEAVVVSVELIKNDFYNPAEHPAHKEYQFKWVFKVREPGFEGVQLTAFTSQALSSHPNAVLGKWIAACDPTFDISKGYDTDDLAGKTCRCLVENKPGTGDNADKVFNKVKSLAATKLASLSDAELAILLAGATENEGQPDFEDDIPF